jgi:ABC-type transport system involved in Fe-S cluster assembly fused permease/ATPase subunit
MDAMERLMQGRTTFMIAHRLSTLAHGDARLKIEHGRLVTTTQAAAITLRPARACGDALRPSMRAQPQT